MFGGARLLATRPCAGSGFRDRQSSEAGPRRGFLFRIGALRHFDARADCRKPLTLGHAVAGTATRYRRAPRALAIAPKQTRGVIALSPRLGICCRITGNDPMGVGG
jgi:hypothetical protein